MEQLIFWVSGIDELNPVKIKNIRIQPNGAAGFSVGNFVASSGLNISYIDIENVNVIGT